MSCDLNEIVVAALTVSDAVPTHGQRALVMLWAGWGRGVDQVRSPGMHHHLWPADQEGQINQAVDSRL